MNNDVDSKMDAFVAEKGIKTAYADEKSADVAQTMWDALSGAGGRLHVRLVRTPLLGQEAALMTAAPLSDEDAARWCELFEDEDEDEDEDEAQ